MSQWLVGRVLLSLRTKDFGHGGPMIGWFYLVDSVTLDPGLARTPSRQPPTLLHS